MKQLVEYINESYIVESLKADAKKFFNKVYDTQQTLIKDNKPVSIDVDIKQLKKPKSPFAVEDLNDKSIKQIISNKLVGFPIINQMLRNAKMYLHDEEKELKVQGYPYFYVQDKNVFLVGMCLFDDKTSYIDGFIHLVAFDTSLVVAKADELNKAMLNDFIKDNKDKYKGITAKPTHPKIKAILTKLGFSSFKDSKELMTLQIK